MPQSSPATTRPTVTIGGQTFGLGTPAATRPSTVAPEGNTVLLDGNRKPLMIGGEPVGLGRPVDAATVASTQPLQIPQGKLTFAAVNATLNCISTFLLIVGIVLIKQRKRIAHQNVMLAALTTSAVFLVCYLTSKIIYGELTTAMVSNGRAPKWATTLYLAVLLPHLLAAVGMLPLIGKSLYHAYRGEFEKHRRIAGPTWYVWFYVSVSGVLVYWMLYHWLRGYSA